MKLDVSGNLLWRHYTGMGGIDYGSSLIQTSDGGIVVAGFTSSQGAGQADIYIQKLNSSGIPLWDKTIGSTGIEYGYSIIQTNEGGFAIAGYTNSFGAGGSDYFIVKLDTGGTVQMKTKLSETPGMI